MMMRWEQRVAAGLLARRGAPVSTSYPRGCCWRGRDWRGWGGHARISVLVTVSMVIAVVAVPVVAVSSCCRRPKPSSG